MRFHSSPTSIGAHNYSAAHLNAPTTAKILYSGKLSTLNSLSLLCVCLIFGASEFGVCQVRIAAVGVGQRKAGETVVTSDPVCSPFSATAFQQSDCSDEGLSKTARFLDSRKELSMLLVGGIVVDADAACQADVLIVGEVVEAVCEHRRFAEAGIHKNTVNRHIDASGLLIMPGGIDPHTHLDMPFMGTVACDDFDSGHQAALAGGTTTHLDFALPVDGSLLKGYDTWIAKASGKAHIDYAFHVAVTAWNERTHDEMEVLVKEKGVNSFKFFMAYKGALMVNDEQLLKGMKRAKELGALVQVHAENGDAVAEWQRHMVEDLQVTGPEGHALSRPPLLEGEATQRAITFARLLDCPLYVVHVMSIEALKHIAQAKQEGARVFGEATLAGIALDEASMWSKDFHWAAAHVMSPPIRKHCTDGLALQKAIRDRIITLLGTDHAAFTTAQKERGRSDFRLIPNGVGGIQERISLSWHLLVSGLEPNGCAAERRLSGLTTDEGYTRKELLSAPDFVRLTSTEAAKVFNLYPKKGVITKGSDADMYIFNPHAEDRISAKLHKSNLDINIFEGMRLSGKVEITISRGEIVWENGKVLSSKGRGRYLRTSPFAEYVFGGLKAEEKRTAAQRKAPVSRVAARSDEL